MFGDAKHNPNDGAFGLEGASPNLLRGLGHLADGLAGIDATGDGPAAEFDRIDAAIAGFDLVDVGLMLPEKGTDTARIIAFAQSFLSLVEVDAVVD